MNILHKILHPFLTLIFCSMLTITSANSQEEFKYRYKVDGIILHKNMKVIDEVPEEPEDPCLTGEIGTVCETDGAIYFGVSEDNGDRLYVYPSVVSSGVWNINECSSKLSPAWKLFSRPYALTLIDNYQVVGIAGFNPIDSIYWTDTLIENNPTRAYIISNYTVTYRGFSSAPLNNSTISYICFRKGLGE